nr:Uncharacterised protein [Ipomoea batatas]
MIPIKDNNHIDGSTYYLLSIASVIFQASKLSGPFRIQDICPEGPLTCIKTTTKKPYAIGTSSTVQDFGTQKEKRRTSARTKKVRAMDSPKQSLDTLISGARLNIGIANAIEEHVLRRRCPPASAQLNCSAVRRRKCFPADKRRLSGWPLAVATLRASQSALSSRSVVCLRTPPLAMVTDPNSLLNSSSFLTANWMCLGTILFFLLSLAAFPASSKTYKFKESTID